jgi:hypothetical protein
MIFTLALGALLFAAASKIFGAPAAAFALGLFIFDPTSIPKITAFPVIACP